jgi:hypothetical protein
MKRPSTDARPARCWHEAKHGASRSWMGCMGSMLAREAWMGSNPKTPTCSSGPLKGAPAAATLSGGSGAAARSWPRALAASAAAVAEVTSVTCRHTPHDSLSVRADSPFHELQHNPQLPNKPAWRSQARHTTLILLYTMPCTW